MSGRRVVTALPPPRIARGPSIPVTLCMIGATLSLVLGGYQFINSSLNNSSLIPGIITLAFGAVVSAAAGQMYLKPAQHVLWSIAVLAASLPLTLIALIIRDAGGLPWTILTAPYSLLGGTLGLFWRTRR